VTAKRSCPAIGKQIQYPVCAADKTTDVEAVQELVTKSENKSVTAENWQEYVKK